MDDINHQIEEVIKELKEKKIDVHEAMKLIDIIYKDYLDFYPEEKEKYYGRTR